jgi:hypothetical protein
MQSPVLSDSDFAPVAAGSPKRGIVGSSQTTPVELRAWILELGENARTAQFRADRNATQGRFLLALRTRRSRIRARREVVRRVLASAELPLPMPVAFVDSVSTTSVADRIDDYLADRA